MCSSFERDLLDQNAALSYYHPATASYNARVLASLTKGELVALSRDEFRDKVIALYKTENPRRRVTSFLKRKIEEQPEYAWGIRNILEGLKWEDPIEFLEAYGKFLEICSFDAEGPLNIGLAYSLKSFLSGIDNPYPRLHYIRTNIVSRMEKAHEVIERMGVVLPSPSLDRLYSRLECLGFSLTFHSSVPVLCKRIHGVLREIDGPAFIKDAVCRERVKIIFEEICVRMNYCPIEWETKVQEIG